ncbi:hypothetical protein [Paradesulfitobacterium ferrireducens]|uniref:hypothetical protein n=1 Tax=Paradesulfitobacterium ferrireducens TaxID=2816476 RepID=UPI001A907D2C|nr:hypothetical protein [Paradesulfitobacterium ferrireducens]
MSRKELLRRERERVLAKLATDYENRTKWLIALMDIDDEMEELTDRADNTSGA